MLPAPWQDLLESYLQTEAAAQLFRFVEEAYAGEATPLPPRADLFRALRLCTPENTRVIILGQDPYHTPGVAHGLAFSVLPPNPTPPSLRNIFKELASDVGGSILPSTDLTAWAEQGVLLLNTALTVLPHQPLSHTGKGWEAFTGAILEALSARPDPRVYLLWGNPAKRFTRHINPAAGSCILTAAHPSPLSASRGFFGCRHFSQANAFLTSRGLPPIRW